MWNIALALGEGNASQGVRLALERKMPNFSDEIFPHYVGEKLDVRLMVDTWVRAQGFAPDNYAAGCGQTAPDWPDKLLPYIDRHGRMETLALSPERRDPSTVDGWSRIWTGGRLSPELNCGVSQVFDPATGRAAGHLLLASPWGKAKPYFLGFSQAVPAEILEKILRIFADWEYPEAKIIKGMKHDPR
jgi:hypothetical protein